MKLEIIPTKGILYDKCENLEQLYDNYYFPLLVEFKELQKQNAELIKTKNKALSYIRNYNHMSLRYQDAEAKDRLNLIKKILNDREDYQDKLQNNWNELKKWLEEEKGQWGKDNSCWYESVLDKMQELQGEGNNE